LHWPYSDGFGKRDIDTSADYEIKRVVAGGLTRGDAAGYSTAIREQISVKIRVSSAEHCFNKGLEVLLASLYDRTNVVREQIPLSRNETIRHTRTNRVPGGDYKVVRKAAIALEFSLDSNVPVDVKSSRATAPVQGERADDAIVLRIGVNVGIVDRNLNLGVVLSKRHRSK
jgi:hypothetical protein